MDNEIKHDEVSRLPKSKQSPNDKVVTDTQYAESGPGWDVDDPFLQRTAKGDYRNTSGEKRPKDNDDAKPRDRWQSKSDYGRNSCSPTKYRNDGVGNYNYTYSSNHRRSRSRESARSFVRPANRRPETRSPPKRVDERSNAGRYDYITKRNRSPSTENHPTPIVKDVPPVKNTMKSSSNTQDEKSSKESYVTKTEFKAVMSLLFRSNRNYNNLLQMFVNEIAQRQLINKAVGGRDNSSTTSSNNQSSSRDVKETSINEMLLKSEREDEAFNTLFEETKTGL